MIGYTIKFKSSWKQGSELIGEVIDKVFVYTGNTNGCSIQHYVIVSEDKIYHVGIESIIEIVKIADK